MYPVQLVILAVLALLLGTSLLLLALWLVGQAEIALAMAAPCGLRWPSRLVAAAAENRLNFRRTSEF